MVVHYAIGVVLVLLYFLLLRLVAAVPTFLNALLYGIATTVIPWLYLYPVWGYGWLGANARGIRLTFSSVYSHAVYGLGIALWTVILTPA